jgi:hypothetical protein
LLKMIQYPDASKGWAHIICMACVISPHCGGSLAYFLLFLAFSTLI